MITHARRAVASIRACVQDGRFALTMHFSERMVERGLFWPDVQAVIDDPRHVRAGGMDDFGRPRWVFTGDVMSVGTVEVVCVVETDESGVEFITLCWEH